MRNVLKTHKRKTYKHAYLLLQLMNSCAATEILSDVYINIHKRKTYKHAYLFLQLSELMNSCAATEILSDVYINVHKRKIYKHDNLFSSSEGIRTGRLRPKLT